MKNPSEVIMSRSSDPHFGEASFEPSRRFFSPILELLQRMVSSMLVNLKCAHALLVRRQFDPCQVPRCGDAQNRLEQFRVLHPLLRRAFISAGHFQFDSPPSSPAYGGAYAGRPHELGCPSACNRDGICVEQLPSSVLSGSRCDTENGHRCEQPAALHRPLSCLSPTESDGISDAFSRARLEKDQMRPSGESV